MDGVEFLLLCHLFRTSISVLFVRRLQSYLDIANHTFLLLQLNLE